MKKYYLTIIIVLHFNYISAQQIESIFDQQYFPIASINGAYCPNITDDEIGSGGYDFNGSVEFVPNNKNNEMGIILSMGKNRFKGFKIE